MFTDIKVGFTCNNRCIHCVVEPSRRRLVRSGTSQDSSTIEVLSFIDEAHLGGSSSIVLTGGEITLREDFPLLVEHAIKLGMEVAVQTNGRRLEAWAQSGALKTMRGTFTVAVHGPNAGTHDAVTRRPGSFDETLRGLRALQTFPAISLTAKLVISRRNCDYLLETLEMLSGMGLRNYNVAFPHAEGFSASDLEAIVPRYREIRAELERCAAFFARERHCAEFETIPYCVSTPEVWQRSADVALILQAVANPGFIRATGDERLHDWEAERSQIKIKPARCSECLFDKACEGPWREYVEAYGDDELQPVRDFSVLDLLG